MNSFNFLNLKILLLFNFFSSKTFAAPQNQSGLCNIKGTSMVNCTGQCINDASLLALKKQLSIHHKGVHFDELLISETNITKIDANLFTEISFKYVHISNNDHLVRIDERAFQPAQVTDRLMVATNKMLTSANNNTSLYRIANQLQVTAVNLNLDLLEEVPSFAFSSNTSLVHQHQKYLFQTVYLSYNLIKKIHSNAFYLLDSTREIDISNNQLTHISSQAFNFANHHMKEWLKIKLAYNYLRTTSFEPNFIELYHGGNETETNLVLLDLSNNLIKELNETVFKPLLVAAQNLTIDLTHNWFNCQSPNNAWLFKKENARLSHKIKGITC